jgi:acyl dehydratase
MSAAGFAMATVAAHVGREIGVSGWLTVDQPRIDEFADCTGDRQWIHVDVERAQRESPYGGTIAHGHLTLSLAASLAIEAGVIPADAAAALNYGLDKVRFIAPVRSGTRVRNRVVLQAAEDKGRNRLLVTLQNTIEIEGEDRPALIAESLALLIGAAAQ